MGQACPLTDKKKKKKKEKKEKKEKKDKDEKETKEEEPAVEDATIVDEIIIYGKRKFVYIELREVAKTVNNPNLNLKEVQKSVVITKLKKDGEKAFTTATYLDNGYYAIGCASGNIYINKGADAICLIEKCFNKSIGAMYYNGNNTLYAGGFDRMFKTFNIKKNIKSFCGKNSKAIEKLTERYIDVYGSDMVFQPKAITVAEKYNKVFIGVKSNQIVQIDQKEYLEESSKSGLSIIVDGHDGEITSLSTHPELNLFITSGNDQSIKLWNAKKLKSIQCHEFIQDKSNNKDENKDEEKTHSHSRSRSVSRGSLKTGKEIVKCCFSNDGKLIAFATEDSKIGVVVFEQFLIDKERFMKCTMVQIPTKARASKNSISYLRFSPCNKILSVAHFAEKQIYNYTIEKLKMNKIKLISWSPMPHHHAPMNLQWSNDSKLMKTCTRGFEIIYWSIDIEKKQFKKITDIPDPDDKTIQFYGEPLPAGWDTQGLYQSQLNWETYNITDCVLCDSTLNREISKKNKKKDNNKDSNKLLMSGDIFGDIRVFNYPAINPNANQKYTGHSQMVAGIGKLTNKEQIISCGGMDMSVFQWDVKYGEPKKEKKLKDKKDDIKEDINDKKDNKKDKKDKKNKKDDKKENKKDNKDKKEKKR